MIDLFCEPPYGMRPPVEWGQLSETTWLERLDDGRVQVLELIERARPQRSDSWTLVKAVQHSLMYFDTRLSTQLLRSELFVAVIEAVEGDGLMLRVASPSPAIKVSPNQTKTLDAIGKLSLPQEHRCWGIVRGAAPGLYRLLGTQHDEA